MFGAHRRLTESRSAADAARGGWSSFSELRDWYWLRTGYACPVCGPDDCYEHSTNNWVRPMSFFGSGWTQDYRAYWLTRGRSDYEHILDAVLAANPAPDPPLDLSCGRAASKAEARQQVEVARGRPARQSRPRASGR